MMAWLGRTLLSERQSKARSDQLLREIETISTSLERSRIAREIHDNVGHALTSLNIQLELTSRLLEQDLNKATESLVIARNIAHQAVKETRSAVSAIRTGDYNLSQAIRRLTQDIIQQQHIDFALDVEDVSIPPASKHHLYCIIKECLINVQKHAAANKVTVELKQNNGTAHLLIIDDGKGMEDGATSTGYGIQGMKERVESLGGILTINSKLNQGTSIAVTVPT
jgi:signal transduction histidine kinase